MHQRPFLITSAGRTGTKWLAAQLQVPHEPSKWSGRAVSPKHLWMWVHQDWRPPMETEFGVVVRDPFTQLKSVKRRAAALKAPAKLTHFLRWWPRYLAAMQLMVDWGAVVISYEMMVANCVYLERIAKHFDCQVAEDRFNDRLNRFEGKVPGLKPREAELCEKAKEAYDQWLTKHGM